MIYILEDDASIRKLVVYTLNSQGMEAEGFERPSSFWRALEERQPDLVLLDIMLPEEDGLQVLKRLRADSNTRRLPVLMLTAKSTEYDKVLGLDQGHDGADGPHPYGPAPLRAGGERRQDLSSGRSLCGPRPPCGPGWGAGCNPDPKGVSTALPAAGAARHRIHPGPVA